MEDVKSSNGPVIPILSSSPPPIDTEDEEPFGGGNYKRGNGIYFNNFNIDEDDGDDFGDFTTFASEKGQESNSPKQSTLLSGITPSTVNNEDRLVNNRRSEIEIGPSIIQSERSSGQEKLHNNDNNEQNWTNSITISNGECSNDEEIQTNHHNSSSVECLSEGISVGRSSSETDEVNESELVYDSSALGDNFVVAQNLGASPNNSNDSALCSPADEEQKSGLNRGRVDDGITSHTDPTNIIFQQPEDTGLASFENNCERSADEELSRIVPVKDLRFEKNEGKVVSQEFECSKSDLVNGSPHGDEIVSGSETEENKLSSWNGSLTWDRETTTPGGELTDTPVVPTADMARDGQNWGNPPEKGQQDEVEEEEDDFCDFSVNFPTSVSHYVSGVEDHGPVTESPPLPSLPRTAADPSPGTEEIQKNVFQDDDFDDDEWADFSTSSTTQTKPEGAPVSDPPATGWGVVQTVQSTTSDSINDSSWATFSPTTSSTPPKSPSADFGNFSTDDQAVRNLADTAPKGPGMTQTPIPLLSDRIAQVILISFPYDESESSDPNSTPLDIMTLHAVITKCSEESAPKSAGSVLWTQLLDPDCIPVFQWHDALTNQKLLKSLSMDTRNILPQPKKSNVPIYASNLGLLQPSRPGSSSLKDFQKDCKPSAMSDSPAGDHVDDGPPASAILQVKFDWDSSGLTNPLDKNRSTSILNLDIFATQGSVSGKSLTTLDAELLDFSGPAVEPPKQNAIQNEPAFAEILATLAEISNNISKKETAQTKTISKEAQGVIERLPNLNFMRSPVLMFPMGKLNSTVDSAPETDL